MSPLPMTESLELSRFWGRDIDKKRVPRAQFLGLPPMLPFRTANPETVLWGAADLFAQGRRDQNRGSKTIVVYGQHPAEAASRENLVARHDLGNSQSTACRRQFRTLMQAFDGASGAVA